MIAFRDIVAMSPALRAQFSGNQRAVATPALMK
jgi:hypothetical protein